MKNILSALLLIVIQVSISQGQILTSEVKVELIDGLTSIKGLTIPSRYYKGQSSNGSAIEIEVPSSSFNAIRGYNGSQNVGDFYFFDDTWPHASSGAINLKGITAVTIGPWGDPGTYFRTSDGFVGIGTSQPSHKLTVMGSNSSQGLLIPGKYNFGKNPNGSAIEIEVPTSGFNAIRGYNGSQSVGDFYFFDDTWAHASSGAINLRGITAVTIGSWGDPDAYFRASDGFVGIGTSNPTEQLHVNGNIRAKAPIWSDFVFETNYELPSLEEVERHIKKKGHLKDIPNEKEVAENGINLGEMDAKLLQKIEELTLYLIEQNKQNAKLIKRVEKLEKKLKLSK